MFVLERFCLVIMVYKIVLVIFDVNYIFKRGSSEIKVIEIKDEKVKVIRKFYSIGRVEILFYLVYLGDVFKFFC